MDRPMYYRLRDDGELEPCSLLEWAHSFEDFKKRQMAEDVVQTPDGEARVSTVFLGMDHNWGMGKPLLFETMVFGPEKNWSAILKRELAEAHEMYRYHTKAEALAGHAAALAMVKSHQMAKEQADATKS